MLKVIKVKQNLNYAAVSLTFTYIRREINEVIRKKDQNYYMYCKLFTAINLFCD